MAISIQNNSNPARSLSSNSVNDDRKNIPKEYLNIAKAMEKQFAEFMLEQMKKSVDSNDPDSTALNYYKSLLNSEHADRLVEKDGGLGLQKVILDQIYPKHLRRDTSIKKYEAQNQAPLSNKQELDHLSSNKKESSI